MNFSSSSFTVLHPFEQQNNCNDRGGNATQNKKGCNNNNKKRSEQRRKKSSQMKNNHKFSLIFSKPPSFAFK